VTEPEGRCEVAWQAWCGSHRHYCDNAATCMIVIADDDDRDAYPSCDACRDELIELGIPLKLL
jgi:hypothetical protein